MAQLANNGFGELSWSPGAHEGAGVQHWALVILVAGGWRWVIPVARWLARLGLFAVL